MSRFTHYLKCWPAQFGAVRDGLKPFEIRREDRSRPFAVGDFLQLSCWDPETKWYTGRVLCVEVVSRISAAECDGTPWAGAIGPGFVVLGIRRMPFDCVIGGQYFKVIG